MSHTFLLQRLAATPNALLANTAGGLNRVVRTGRCSLCTYSASVAGCLERPSGGPYPPPLRDSKRSFARISTLGETLRT